MLEIIFAAVAVVLIGVGMALGTNYRGAAGWFTAWSARPRSAMARRRGPHRWFNLRFQTRVYRAYGWAAVVLGFVLLNAAFHH